MRRAPWERRACAVLLAAVSCARLGYDPLDAQLDLGSPGGGGTPSSSGGTNGAGSAGSAGSSGSGGSVADGGGSGEAGATASGGTGVGAGGLPDGGSPTAAGGAAGEATGGAGGDGTIGAGCGPAVPTATWSFTSDDEGWVLSLDGGTSGTLVWTAATGDPAPGALDLDGSVNNPNSIRVYLEQGFGDLTGQVLSARVFLESGTVSTKLFVQSGASYGWSEGPQVDPAVGQWSCLGFDFANPASGGANLDATDVRRIGVLVYGGGALRLYVDQVTY